MEFFKTLSKTNIKNIVLDVLFIDDDITVCVVPKNTAKDEALNQLKPLFITTTIEQIDSIFFDRLSTPLKHAQNAFDNAMAFEARLDEQQKRTAEKKELASKIEKLESKLKKIMEGPLAEVDKKNASKIVNQIKDLDKSNGYALECLAVLSQGGLF